MIERSTTGDRAALREAARVFAEREIAPHLQSWEDAGEVPRALHRSAATAGLLGVGFAEALGGQGGDLLDTIAVQEGIIAGGGSSGLLSALFTHGIAAPHVAAHGSPELQERWVRPTLAGELIGALGITESEAGSDVGALRTTAVRDGDSWVINGSKTFITSGTRADYVTTAVRTGGPGSRGLSLIVVPTDAPGFTANRRLAKMGWHCSDTGELSYVDVRVPVGNLVGEENSGFAQIAEQFVSERIALAVHGHALAARCLAVTLAHCRTRETFGKPLIERQVVQHQLVQMRRLSDLARAHTLAVAEQYLAEGLSADVLGGVCAAKQTACESAQEVADLAVQLHGGSGYLHGTEVERHYRDARLLPIGGGATSVMADLAAKMWGYTA